MAERMANTIIKDFEIEQDLEPTVKKIIVKSYNALRRSLPIPSNIIEIFLDSVHMNKGPSCPETGLTYFKHSKADNIRKIFWNEVEKAFNCMIDHY